MSRKSKIDAVEKVKMVERVRAYEISVSEAAHLKVFQEHTAPPKHFLRLFNPGKMRCQPQIAC
ncbi:MAG: hypothetical protein II930_01455, partial [Lachnospiraceae bacterium]|nr:hypothetical protein [Lachnospiraceae bacterium]